MTTSPSGKTLILEIYRHTLVVVRSLNAQGMPMVFGIQEGKPAELALLPSRLKKDELWVHPPWDQPEAFKKSLLKFLKSREDIDSMFPVGELSLSLLSEMDSELPSHVRVAMPNPKVVHACLHKDVSTIKAQESGITVAPTIQLNPQSDLVDTAKTLGYPWIVKSPTSDHLVHGKKCFTFKTEQDLKKWQWPQEIPMLLAQPSVAGFRHNCMFYAEHGALKVYFEQKVLRTDRWDGTGYGVDCIAIPPSKKRKTHTETLIKNLGYHGIGCVQFLVDPSSDDTVFLEINPRLDATAALPLHLGVSFPLLAMKAALPTEKASLISLPNPPLAKGPLSLALWRFKGTDGKLGGRTNRAKNGIFVVGQNLSLFSSGPLPHDFHNSGPRPNPSTLRPPGKNDSAPHDWIKTRPYKRKLRGVANCPRS